MGYRYLEERNVLAIKRQLVSGTATLTSLAEKYDCALSTILWIADGRTWKEVQVPGWKKYLTLRNSKKKFRLQQRQKLLTLKGYKKEARAPKRHDHATWSKQFSEPKKKRA